MMTEPLVYRYPPVKLYSGGVAMRQISWGFESVSESGTVDKPTASNVYDYLWRAAKNCLYVTSSSVGY